MSDQARDAIADVMRGVVRASAIRATSRDGMPHADQTGYEDRQADALLAALPDLMREHPKDIGVRWEWQVASEGFSETFTAEKTARDYMRDGDRLRYRLITDWEEVDGSPHVCDDSCRHDQTIHDTAFGSVKIITDCRARRDHFFGPNEVCGPHTCTDDHPCDTRPDVWLRPFTEPTP